MNALFNTLTAALLPAILIISGLLLLVFCLFFALFEIDLKDFKVRRKGRGATLPLMGAVLGVILLAVGILIPVWAAVNTPQPTGPVRVTFNALPDGTPITADRILRGDEFLASGVRLSGAPETHYCAQGVAAAVRPPHYAVSFNFLTTAAPDDANMCNTVPVAIDFTSPVRRVTLIFAGASVTYVLRAFDAAGAPLGKSEQAAVYGNNTFQIGFSSGSANISRVTFGRTQAVTAVQVIVYER